MHATCQSVPTWYVRRGGLALGEGIVPVHRSELCRISLRSKVKSGEDLQSEKVFAHSISLLASVSGM